MDDDGSLKFLNIPVEEGKSLTDGLLMKHRAAWFGWCKHADARNLYKKLIQKSYESK